MNTEDRDTRAAEYVLGTLDPAERTLLSEQTRDNPRLHDTIADWERRLGGLESDTSSIAPPDRVWRRVDAAIGAAEQDRDIPVRTVRADQGTWRDVAPGVSKKVLFVDHAAGMESYILRMEAGGSLPSHDHSKLEECLVLEGDVTFGDFALKAGDYHLAAPSFRHEMVTTRGGALMYPRRNPRRRLTRARLIQTDDEQPGRRARVCLVLEHPAL